MIRHIVLLTFVDGATDAQIQAIEDALAKLPARLPELKAYLIGRDLRLNDANATFAVAADFDDVDGYIAYRDDVEHRRIITELITPILAGRTAAQYEVTP